MSPVGKSEASGADHAAGERRFRGTGRPEAGVPRRFNPDRGALDEALQAVRALDADSYQALLWALGLTPDPRLSVPGCSRRSPDPSGRLGRGSAA